MNVSVSYDIPMEGWKRFVLLTLEFRNLVKKDIENHKFRIRL